MAQSASAYAALSAIFAELVHRIRSPKTTASGFGIMTSLIWNVPGPVPQQAEKYDINPVDRKPSGRCDAELASCSLRLGSNYTSSGRRGSNQQPFRHLALSSVICERSCRTANCGETKLTGASENLTIHENYFRQ